jgi:lactate permease
MYRQNYNPTGHVALSTIVAAIPIVVLLYFIALHPHRDERGVRRLGVAAPFAAFYGVIAAFLVACLVFGMPLPSALSAFALGTLSGLVGIIWIVLAAMFLYTITVITGRFEIVKESIVHISFDRRLQVLLIAFSFGAIIEGTSGFGTPVAIAGAVMVGLGYSPFQSAVLNLLANTAPVAWGAIGTPIVTLAAVSGLDALALSTAAGHQLPWVSMLVPFWLVVTFVKMEGGTWREAFEVWPGAVVSGGSFALVQFLASRTASFHLITDVVAGVVSIIVTALFLRFAWHPKTRFLLKSERAAPAAPLPPARAIVAAWMPWAILILCCAVWGSPTVKKTLNAISQPVFEMPALHNVVQRVPPVAPPGAKPEAARFTFNWLSAAGTGVFVAALLSGLLLRLTLAQWKLAVVATARRMRVPVLVIAQVLGLGFLTRYSGADAVLGLAFTSAGAAYPFFAAYLGWLGVFLTGSDTASNALFGSLQRITAQQLHLNETLIVATNSTGGVMGKMIDAQSIMVACAACYEDPYERTHALGPIFRTVWWHSVAGAAVIGAIAMIQTYW